MHRTLTWEERSVLIQRYWAVSETLVVMDRPLGSAGQTVNKRKAEVRRNSLVPRINVLTMEKRGCETGGWIKYLKETNASSEPNAEYQCDDIRTSIFMIHVVLTRNPLPAWQRSIMSGKERRTGEVP